MYKKRSNIPGSASLDVVEPGAGSAHGFDHASELERAH